MPNQNDPQPNKGGAKLPPPSFTPSSGRPGRPQRTPAIEVGSPDTGPQETRRVNPDEPPTNTDSQKIVKIRRAIATPGESAAAAASRGSTAAPASVPVTRTSYPPSPPLPSHGSNAAEVDATRIQPRAAAADDYAAQADATRIQPAVGSHNPAGAGAGQPGYGPDATRIQPAVGNQAGAAAHPQSFNPQNGRSMPAPQVQGSAPSRRLSGRPIEQGAQGAGGAQNAPGSFVPEGARAGQPASTHPPVTADATRRKTISGSARSTSAASAGLSGSNLGGSGRPSGGLGGSISGGSGSGGAGSGGAGRPPAGSGGSTRPAIPARPAKKRSKKRITLTICLVLVALMIAWPIGLLTWANSKLNHIEALSGAKSTSGATYLIAGSDSRGEDSGSTIKGARADTIMLLHVPDNGPSALISLPRDIYVPIPGHNANKINAAFSFGGAPLLVETVEEFTNLTVDHYVEVGFNGVKGIVDAVGGVELCLDYDVKDKESKLNWKAGCHEADGKTALAFARMRKADPLGDIGRAQRQRQVVSAVAQQLKSPADLLNPGTQTSLIEAGTGALAVSEGTGFVNLGKMALAFQKANSDSGITGTPPLLSLNYRPGGVGSAVQVDEEASKKFFKDIAAGNLKPGEYNNLR